MIRAETLNDLPADLIKRMFANNYSLLISMTDLNCNLPPLPPSVPFVGYPGGQRSTPWMRLLCSKISKHGPAGILLPRGYRIRKFPYQMRYSKLRLQRFIQGASILNYSKRFYFKRERNNKNIFNLRKQYKVSPWDQESQVIEANMALYYLNEALMHHPIFVCETQTSENTKLALPCSQSELNEILGNCDEYSEKIQSIVDLESTVGFLSFQNFEGRQFLESVSFGIPRR